VSRILLLSVTLLIAVALRAWKLGQLSFWYDEVVTMRLAEAPTPAALLDLLPQIDATRAPLHPLLLHGWIKLCGSNEVSVRALSVVCGVATVGLIWWIGRLVFDPATGLCAGWLAALSPLLVYYSREARMYALLVMLTCLCWGLLFALCRWRHWWWQAAYAAGLAALIYTHPLGLLMAGTLALASLIFVRQFPGAWRAWSLTHAAALLAAAPSIPRYFDHPPEFLSGRLPIKFLLGTPIGFIGGNFMVLGCLVGVIVFGLVRRHRRLTRLGDWTGPACLVLWLVVPPALLYAYSWIVSPIFGPSRYTLFVAPAYLILVAQGLARLPPLSRSISVTGLTFLEIQALLPMVYAPDLKADWRASAAAVAARTASHPGEKVTFIVLPPGSGANVEVETARYYLPKGCHVVPWRDDLPPDVLNPKYGEVVYLSLAVGREPPQGGSHTRQTRDFIAGAALARYPGLLVYSRVGRRPRPRPVPRAPTTSAYSGPGRSPPGPFPAPARSRHPSSGYAA
jgi:hypothetical protein